MRNALGNRLGGGSPPVEKKSHRFGRYRELVRYWIRKLNLPSRYRQSGGTDS